jgi:hypothetical protein
VNLIDLRAVFQVNPLEKVEFQVDSEFEVLQRVQFSQG